MAPTLTVHDALDHEPAFVCWGPSGAPRLDCSAMDHADHTNLLRAGIADARPVWADLGAGRGAFTLALADQAKGNRRARCQKRLGLDQPRVARGSPLRLPESA